MPAGGNKGGAGRASVVGPPGLIPKPRPAGVHYGAAGAPGTTPVEMAEAFALDETPLWYHLRRGEAVEKRKPTYDLAAFQAASSTVRKLNVTGAALQGAREMGTSPQEMVAAIQDMSDRQSVG